MIYIHRGSSQLPRTHNNQTMDVAKAVHQFNLAHFKPLNSILRQHAVIADTTACENALNYPAHFSHCPNCGIMAISGLTSLNKIIYKTIKGTKSRKRNLHTKCINCGHIEINNSLINKKEVAPVKVDQTKRKKKKTELSALLGKKRELEKEKSAKPTLDLMSFMQ